MITKKDFNRLLELLKQYDILLVNKIEPLNHDYKNNSFSLNEINETYVMDILVDHNLMKGGNQ